MAGFLKAVPHIHQARLFELRELHGDPALPHAQDLLQFRHAELFLLEQAQDSHASFVAEQAYVEGVRLADGSIAQALTPAEIVG